MLVLTTHNASVPASEILLLTPMQDVLLRERGTRCYECHQSQVAGHTFTIRQASSTAELRALGYLRADCFYQCDSDRSEYAQRVRAGIYVSLSCTTACPCMRRAVLCTMATRHLHCSSTHAGPPNLLVWLQAFRRMKADDQWELLERKLQGTEVGWEQVTVTPFLAALLASDSPTLYRAMQQSMRDLSAQIPAAADLGDSAPELVVGSLELNVGRTLPAEELVGRLPEVRCAFEA